MQSELGQRPTQRTPPSLATGTLVLPASQEIPADGLFPTGEPSLACRAGAGLEQSWSRAGAFPPRPCRGTVPCVTTELNHGLAAALSTHRRDLAIPRAINRARLLSWAPHCAVGVRESKANSQGGGGLSLPKERSGNNLSGSRNRSAALSPLIAPRLHVGSAEPRGNNGQ